MKVDWLPLVLGVLVAVTYFGFIGGVTGALVGRGGEDRSLLENAAIRAGRCGHRQRRMGDHLR